MNKFNQIKNTIEKLGYTFFEEGNYNLNIVFERTNNKITNYFTDKLYILYYVAQSEFIYECAATTKPGIKGSIDSPITYDNITGTAIILPGQYRSSFEFVDSCNGFTKYPYLRQIKGLNYFRDGDKDYEIDDLIDSDKDGYVSVQQNNKIFGTHIHRMSNYGVTGMPVNNWSLGCIGAEEPYFREVIKLVRKSTEFYGNKFTLTLIESKDLVSE